jgi:phosphoribosylanthranilate isomerase
MRDPSNIVEVAALKPDYMGFIYYKNSPRYVGEDFQAPGIGKRTKRVGVFVNHPVDFIFREVERNSLDTVQLHGYESPEVCAQIKSKGITVIKTFSIGQDFGFAVTKPYQYQVDFFMFDTKGKNYGGTGQTFDWTILHHYTSPTPFFLSGGLSEKNMAEISAIKTPRRLK